MINVSYATSKLIRINIKHLYAQFQINLYIILCNVLAYPDNPEDNPDYHNPDAVADNSDLADDPEQVNTDSD